MGRPPHDPPLTVPSANRRAAFARAGYRCEDCGLATAGRGTFPGVLELHHKLPVKQGGSHDLDNLAALCEPCHDKRHGRGLLLALSREASLRLRLMVTESGVSMAAIGMHLGYDPSEMSRVMSGRRRVAEDFESRYRAALVAIAREQYERARRATSPGLPQADDPLSAPLPALCGGTP